MPNLNATVVSEPHESKTPLRYLVLHSVMPLLFLALIGFLCLLPMALVRLCDLVVRTAKSVYAFAASLGLHRA